VQPLRCDEELDSLATGVRQRERCLQSEEGLVLHAELVDALDDDWSDQRLIAADDALMTEHVAVRVNRNVRAVDPAFGVGECGQHFVLHNDGGDCPATRFWMIGSDGGDRLASEADEPVCKHRLVLADQTVRELAGNIAGGDHCLDSIDRPSARKVDADDARIRMW